MNSFEKRVCNTIRATADWLPSDQIITDRHSLRKDLGFDSLAIVHLQVAIEDEFEIRFDPVSTDFITVFETVGSLSNFLSTIKPTKEIL
ncbi:acyl carrier protein [Maridesulfovibrio hydrothermalis]|uniref:Putative Phosphopantetheine-binding n=1 Tax=Maridesulfovibrio hydrothermalis AM13 = DSM 14728 TaxID=1121451 RepID=L0R7V9_9BACT|nr:phosphopantetheine-binding protein [Maridesulfovibrio hydrothermalis]CCO22312.1 putative Phosphopantetheine-binding [Maridesulfovibrio hydrothermalis AM13 = DSM 14728]